MGVLMADKKKGKEPPEPAKGQYTSTRIFTEDSEKLGELAALRRESAAVTFRKVFGELLDASLIEAAERRAADLRKSRD